MIAARKLSIRDCEVKKPHGWTKHSGGRCPVLPDTTVEVRWRSGDVSKHHYAAKQLRWERWPRGEAAGDIIAFRIVESGE